MYKGTLLKDLMAAVERAERGALRRKAVDEMELLRMFELQAPQAQHEPAYAGAA